MSGWFNILLVILTLFCVGILLIWQLGYDPIAHVSCLQKSDSYVSITLTGKKVGQYYCVHTYADGGKQCRSSYECEGDCMVSSDTIVESDSVYGKKVFGFGVCQDSDGPIIGCSQGTIENPTVFCQ